MKSTGAKVSIAGMAKLASPKRVRFHACVAGWSTSNTLRPRPACGFRSENVSSPAPRITTWRTPRATAASRLSSANRLRAAMKTRICRWAGSAETALMRVSASGPRITRATGSLNTLPPSRVWCAARCTAAASAVRLGCPVCIEISLDGARTIALERCIGHNPNTVKIELIGGDHAAAAKTAPQDLPPWRFA